MKALGFGAYYYNHENKWLSTGTSSNFLITIEDNNLIFKSANQLEENEEIKFKIAFIIDENGYLNSGIGFKKNIIRITDPEYFLLEEKYNDCHLIFDVGTTIVIPSENIPLGFHCWLYKNDLLGDENFIDRVIIDIEESENKYIQIRSGNKIHDLGVMEEGKWGREFGNKRPILISGKEVLLTKISEIGKEIWVISFGLIDEDIVY